MTSAAGAAGTGRMRGFTLLEILVVIFIIGLMFSLAVLSVGDGGREESIRLEAQRFRALVALAQERAVLEGREFSVSFTDDGYGFLVLEEDQWQSVSDEELFRQRTLPEGIVFDLTANELPVALVPAEDDEEGPVPHLLVLSSGELTPFELRLSARESPVAYRIEGDLQGRISVGRDEDAF